MWSCVSFRTLFASGRRLALQVPVMFVPMKDKTTAWEDPRRIEHAIVEAAQLLVAPAPLNLEELLRILGEATGAGSVYFVGLPRSEAQQDYIYTIWQRQQSKRPSGWREVEAWIRQYLPAPNVQDEVQQVGENLLVVPVFSREDQFYGYLGLAFPDKLSQARLEEARLLGILGGLLATYFDRQTTEAAHQESEKRWRLLVEQFPEPILLVARDKLVYLNPAGRRLLGAGEHEDLTGHFLLDFFSADQYDEVARQIRQLEAGESVPPFECSVIRLDGEERIVELTAVQMVFEKQAVVQLMLRDLTERRRAEESYRAFVNTITEGIFRIELQQPVAITTLPELQVEHLYRYGYLAECNAVMARWLGVSSSEEVAGRPLAAFRHYFRSRYLREFVLRGYQIHSEEYALSGRQGMRYFVVNAVGTVERDRLVRIWGSAIEVTERIELERRMVQTLEAQQQAIGRDLHDGIGQLLTSIRMLSENIAYRLQTEQHELAELARKIVRFAQQATESVRTIYRGLTPTQLYTEDLTLALEELAYNTNAPPQIYCRFETDGQVSIENEEIKLHLYRIAQEAINNALKHAHASEILLTLRRQNDSIELCVVDNGCGIDPSRSRADSMGLKTMYYRARAIGGILHIHSQPGQGTTICCRLPIERINARMNLPA